MSIETIGVSLTVAATVISVYNTILVNRQSRIVEKQALLQRSQTYPYLKIREAKVSQNTVNLVLENTGETPAFQLGLLVCFIPCSGQRNGHWQFVSEVPFPSGSSMKVGYPTKGYVPLKTKTGAAKLYGKENDVFTAEPMFLFKSSRKGFLKGSLHYDNFEELKERLMSQGIRFVALMIALVYKDAAETLQEFEPIRDFIVDLRKHGNLEQASNDGIPFYDKTVGLEEIPCIDYEFYRKFKSYRAFLEPFEQ